MARRAGKAASRKARQRHVPRTPRPAAPTRPTDATDATDTVGPGAPSTPVPPVGTPDARAATSLTPPRRVTPPLAATGGSTLTARDRAEFHYVERDLRSLGILTVVLAAMLLVAWLAFSALGLTG